MAVIPSGPRRMTNCHVQGTAVPRESIGACGCSPSIGSWAISELELGICYIRQACGEPPEGYELEVIWHEHDLGEYATIGVTWDGPYDAPWDYIQNAQDALNRFDQGVNWAEIVPDEEPEANENQEGVEDEDAGPDD